MRRAIIIVVILAAAARSVIFAGPWSPVTASAPLQNHIVDVYASRSSGEYLVALDSGALAWVNSTLTQVTKQITMPNGFLLTAGDVQVIVDRYGSIVVRYHQALLLSQDGGTTWSRSIAFPGAGVPTLPILPAPMHLKLSSSGAVIAFGASDFTASSSVSIYTLEIGSGTIALHNATNVPLSPFNNYSSALGDADMLSNGDVIVTEYSFHIYRYSAASGAWRSIATGPFFSSTPSAINYIQGHLYVTTYWDGVWELSDNDVLTNPFVGLPAHRGVEAVAEVANGIVAWLSDQSGGGGVFLLNAGTATALSVGRAEMAANEVVNIFRPLNGGVVVGTSLGLFATYSADERAFITISEPTYVPLGIQEICYSEDRLYALDQRGLIAYSSDQGGSWNLTPAAGLEDVSRFYYSSQIRDMHHIYADSSGSLYATAYSPFNVFRLGNQGWSRTFDAPFPNTMTRMRSITTAETTFIFAGNYGGGLAVVNTAARSAQRFLTELGASRDFEPFNRDSVLVVFQSYPNPSILKRVYPDGHSEAIDLNGLVPIDVATTPEGDAGVVLCSDQASMQYLAVLHPSAASTTEVISTIKLEVAGDVITGITRGTASEIYLHGRADNYIYTPRFGDVFPLKSLVESHDNIVRGGDSLFTVQNGTLMRGQPAAFANISTRLRVQSGDKVLIGGFIISGTADKTIVVRAKGPSLAASGIAVTLPDPVLELHNASDVIATNDNWKDTQATEIQATGLQPTQDREAAILKTVAPGAYTVVVRDAANRPGVGLVEVFDLTASQESKLVNMSTRGFVQAGENMMIAGVIVQGASAKNLVVRALGPSLAAHGVSEALADPVLTIYDSQGAVVVMNDDWRESQQTELQSMELAPIAEAESAVFRTLAPGAYTAIVQGKNGSSGNALVELYSVDD